MTGVVFTIMKSLLSWIKIDRKSTRLNSSHLVISYAVCCFRIEVGDRVDLASPGVATQCRDRLVLRQDVVQQHAGVDLPLFFFLILADPRRFPPPFQSSLLLR